MDSPRITVCLPTYNRSSFLEQTLPTILNQSYSDFRLLVCDDGSTDGTQHFLRSINDSRVLILPSDHHRGWPEVINYLLKNAKTEFIAIFHDHDLYEPGLIESSISLLDTYTSAVFSFTGCSWIDESERTVATFIPFPKEFILGSELVKRLVIKTACPICASSVLIRRAVLEKVGFFDPRFGFSGDLDLYIRLSLLGDAVFVRRSVVRVRTWSHSERITKANWEYIRRNREVRLENCQRVLPDKQIIRLLWLVWIRLKYLEIFAREALSYWSHGDRNSLLKGAEALELHSLHPLRAWLAMLAFSTPLGRQLGLFRRSLREGR